MKITNTTPPPVKRSFTIELSEDELKMIVLALGMVTTEEIKNKIKFNDTGCLAGMVYVNPVDIYSTLKDAITDE